MKSRLDHSLQLHRQWTGWIARPHEGEEELGKIGIGAASYDLPAQNASVIGRSSSQLSTQQPPGANSPSVLQQSSRIVSGRPASAIRRAASSTSAQRHHPANGWTPVISSSPFNHLNRSEANEEVVNNDISSLLSHLPEASEKQQKSSSDVSFAGLSSGEVVSLAGLQRTLRRLNTSAADSETPIEARSIATIEALCVILREHPLLGPIVSTIFDLVSRSLYFIPLPFLCEAATPPHLATGCDNPQLWSSWIDCRANRWSNLHTRKMGMLSGSGAVMLLGAEMDQMSEELRANRITTQASKRNAQQIRLNYVQSRKVIKTHFKSWRQVTQTARGKARAAERIANVMQTFVKRLVFHAWRINILNDLYHRKDDHCARLQSVLKDETRQLQLVTEKLDNNQRQRDIAITNVEQMRGIVADLERRLAATKSPMVLDFRRQLAILHKSSSEVIENGVVYFRASSELVPVQTPDNWHGEYGCERVREGVAMPGREKYASRYHIRIEQSPTKVVDPTLEWVNSTIIAFCRSHISTNNALGASGAHYGELQTSFEQFERDCQIRMQIWTDHMNEMRDMERDNMVQLTPTGFISMSCDLNSFAEIVNFPYLYAALLSEYAPHHVVLFHRSAASFVATATMTSVFPVLKAAGICGGFVEAEFCESRRVSPQLRESIHRVVLTRLRTMSILKSAWDAMNAARYPAAPQQQQAALSNSSMSQLPPPPQQQQLGAGPTGVLRTKKGAGLAELVVQRSSTDGLADETAEDVLAWVRQLLSASQAVVKPGTSPTSQEHASSRAPRRRRIVSRKVEEDMLQDANLVLVANLEEDMGDGLAFLGLVVQCLVPPGSGLPDPSATSPVGSGGGLPMTAILHQQHRPNPAAGLNTSKKSAMVSPRSPRASGKTPRGVPPVMATSIIQTHQQASSFRGGSDDMLKSSHLLSASELEVSGNMADDDGTADDAAEALIPTETQAFAKYLCTTVRDVLKVSLPPVVWSTLHTCSRSAKMIFLTALYLKYSGGASAGGSSGALGGGAGSSVSSSPRLTSDRWDGFVHGGDPLRESDSPLRKSAESGHIAITMETSEIDPSGPQHHLQLVPAAGMPSMVPDLSLLKTCLSAKDAQSMRQMLARYAPFIGNTFLRLVALGGDGGKISSDAVHVLLQATGQPPETINAFNSYIASLRSTSLQVSAAAAAAASTAQHSQTLPPHTDHTALTLSHIEFVMALVNVSKTVAAGAAAAAAAAGVVVDAAADVHMHTILNTMITSEALQVLFDASALRKQVMDTSSIQFLRQRSKALVAAYVRHSDWIDDKYRLLEQRCMTEQQFVDAMYNKCIDTIEEGPSSVASAWSSHSKHIRQQYRSALWPLSPLFDGSHVSKVSEFAVRSVFHAVWWTRSGDQKAAELIASQGMGNATQAMFNATLGQTVAVRPPSLRFSGFLEAFIALSRILVPSPWITQDLKLAVLMDIFEGCHLQPPNDTAGK